MGQFSSAYSALNMKMLVVLALVAYVVAEPEAEAKADPWISYGGYGLGYSSLGYGLGYGGYGLGLGYSRGIIGYGKREAEAEPKAAADPWVYGGYRGYGLGYGGYGYSRLGYSGLGYSGLYGYGWGR